MTISQITVWNRALGFLGTRAVASEQENTPEALHCRLYWDSARRQVLRDFPWSFAQRRAWLARMPLPSGFEQEFSFAYACPIIASRPMKFVMKALAHALSALPATAKATP